MAVVINEFEVVPAQEPPAPRDEQPSPRPAPPPSPQDMEVWWREQAERLARVWAH
jgi:hypothetical protein